LAWRVGLRVTLPATNLALPLRILAVPAVELRVLAFIVLVLRIIPVVDSLTDPTARQEFPCNGKGDTQQANRTEKLPQVSKPGRTATLVEAPQQGIQERQSWRIRTDLARLTQRLAPDRLHLNGTPREMVHQT